MGSSPVTTDRWQVLKPIRNLVIDIDGVLYRGTSALPGVNEFLDFLSDASIPFVLATNNSTRRPDQEAGWERSHNSRWLELCSPFSSWPRS